jgi:single-stranded-DNA-specific exonuclease
MMSSVGAAVVVGGVVLPPLSLLGQRWRWVQEEDAAVARAGIALAQSTGLPTVVTHILAGRGYGTPDAMTAFLNPRLEQLPDPMTLKDMDRAIARLKQAIEAKETIAIFGDYDVDGTCATAILARYLKQVGIQPVLYIPDRLTEGYGPTSPAMETLAGQGVKLLITVDTGTTAHEALQKAANLGMDVLVTDHHQPAGALPPAAAILNPQRADDTSALQGLCGSGVVFYLLMGLNRALRQDGFFAGGRVEPRLAGLLDLVALATVADVMPLTTCNRVLVAKGLQQLATWQNRGLACLASVAGVKDDVSATTLGFALAPRLNAAGRIESARTALALLMAENDDEAYPLAESLNTLNKQRQDMEKAILAEARLQAEELFDDETLALVLHAEGWHPGVVGIVASRIKEQFNRPTFILGGDGNGALKGSGRCIAGLNLGAAVHTAKDILLSGGGHAMAAGVSLKAENVEAFRKALGEALRGQLEARVEDAHWPLAYRLAPVLQVEAQTTPAGLTSGLVETLQQIGPFGAGNPEPMLGLTHVKVTYAKPVGATQEHLKLRIADATGFGAPQLDAICFGACNNALGQTLANSGGRSLTLAVTARNRMFNGRPLLDVQVKDALPLL